MGTRHLIAIYSDGKYKVAQYGQFDGYPSCHGLGVLKFCRDMDRTAFQEKVRAAAFMTKEEIKDFNEKNAGTNWKKTHPELSRDAGSEILTIIANRDPGIKLVDQLHFAADSLFCEYAYVIDLDTNKLEAFEGLNHTPLSEGDRFFSLELSKYNCGEQYYPVKLMASFDLNDLPSDDSFLKACGESEDEDASDADLGN